MYTLKELNEINGRFTRRHGNVNNNDLENVNDFIFLLKNERRDNMIHAGDVIEYTNEYGEHFPTAHVERINMEDNTVNICEHANTYIFKNENNNICCNSSGGTWHNIPLDKLTYKGTTERLFWFFGHCGACVDGGIDFYTSVNVWEYSENKEPYNTKTHDKFYFYYKEKENENDYCYYLRDNECCSSRAWRTKREFEAWLKTFRGVINNNIIWTYKNKTHHVSPVEFENINTPVDSFLMNGTVRQCKRIYDDANYTVHTYFVWYYDDSTLDFEERCMKQKKEIDMYKMDWKTPENQIAFRELENE